MKIETVSPLVALITDIKNANDAFIKSQEAGKFRVLSLDGGGARGYLSARMLENIEEYVNVRTNTSLPLGRRFDLMVGTSTGGIIALALSIGKTAKEIADFYAQLVPRIFEKKLELSSLAQYSAPRYPNDRLKAALDSQFGNKTLESVAVDVCITGVSLQTGRPRFHKSSYQNTYLERREERLADIALATSAAPTYFKAARLKHTETMVDGGLCANNPALVAIVDALGFERSSLTRGKRPDGIKDVWLLSIGTGHQSQMPYDANDLANAGLIEWAKHVSDVMFESQSVAVDF